MKESFTKQEIREVIQEVIGDFWNDLLDKAMNRSPSNARNVRNIEDSPVRKQKKKQLNKDDLFTNLNLWMNTFVDDTGKYKGPFVGDFRDGVFIRDPNEDITLVDIKFLEKWNEQYADKHGISKHAVWKANREAYDSFRQRDNALGSFPT